MRDLRRRPGQAALLVVAVVAATTTLTLGLLLRDVTGHPYVKTRAATAGPDVVANVTPLPGGQAADLDGLEGLEARAGRERVQRALPTDRERRQGGRTRAAVQLEGRDATHAAVDRPRSTEGSWIGRGGVVVERSFADAFKLRAGDRITLGGHPFRVVGIAVTAAMSPYPWPSA